MNYLKAYNNIVEKASSRGLRKNKKKFGYTEIHHIKPRCIGGTDDKENLVQVTAREHFILHLLLTKIYPDEHGIIIAAHFIGCLSSSRYDYKVNSRISEYLKIKNSVSNGILTKARWEDPIYREKTTNSIKELVKTENWLKKRSEISKEMWSRDGYRDKMSNILIDRWKNPEFKTKIVKSITEVWSSPELREKARERGKKNWETLEIRNKILKTRAENWGPENSKKRSQLSKNAWKTPGYKEKRESSIQKALLETDYRQKLVDKTTTLWKTPEHRNKVKNTKNINRMLKRFEHYMWEDYFILYEIYRGHKTLNQFANSIKHEYPDCEFKDFRKIWYDFESVGLDIPNEVFVQGIKAAQMADSISCGDTIAQSSSKTFILS